MSLILIGLTLLSNGMIDWAIDICEINSNESYIIDNNQEKNYCCCTKPAESDCCKTTYIYYFTPKFIEDNHTLSFVNPELTILVNILIFILLKILKSIVLT